MVITPVNTAGAERLARARLVRIIAARGADLAHQCTHAAIGFYLHLKPGFQEKIDAGDAFAGEGYAVGLGATVGELYY